MRGPVADLTTRHAVGDGLPGMYFDEPFVQRLCAGLDVVLAPVLSTLDCLPAYLDPDTTPLDLLVWLGAWIGVVVDPGQPSYLQRRLVRAGAELHRWRGTARGIRDAVQTVYGTVPEVAETGGAVWGGQPGAPMPGRYPARLVVRLRVPDPSAFDGPRLDALVAAVKPAHVPHRVELLQAT